jgi:hypothetical protein
MAMSAAAFAVPAETTTYSYDALGRLTNVAHAGTVNNNVNAAYTLDPAGNRSNVTVTTTAPPAAPSFAIGSASATEGSPVTFTVTKTGTTSSTFTVNYATANGTAHAGTDYTAASHTLTFASTDISKTFQVSTIGNSIVDGTRTFSVTLSGASGGATITSGTGTGTIYDNDGITRISGNSALNSGQSWSSPDGRFKLTAQSDFNVVLYQGGTALWASGTSGAGTMGHLSFQTDGNLVLYDSSGVARWASNTSGNSGAVLAIQGDGNVVIYTSTGTPIWSTATGGH